MRDRDTSLIAKQEGDCPPVDHLIEVRLGQTLVEGSWCRSPRQGHQEPSALFDRSLSVGHEDLRGQFHPVTVTGSDKDLAEVHAQ